MDWPKSDHQAAPRFDLPTLLETNWRVLMAPSQRILSCGIYRMTDGTIELRCGFSDVRLVRSQIVEDVERGRALASFWLKVVRATESAEEIPIG